MTIFNLPHKGKRKSIRLATIRSIALAGQNSVTRVAKEIESYYPNVFKEIKKLEKYKVIENRYTESRRSRNPEKYYRLTDKGLSEFINQSSSTKEFSISVIRFCALRKGAVAKDKFDNCWNLFIQKYVGSSLLNGCFFHPDFLESLIKKWRDAIWEPGHDIITSKTIKRRHKVLEFLAENRSVTAEHISKKTGLSREDVLEVLDNYTLTQNDLKEYTDDVILVQKYNNPDSITRWMYSFIEHLIVVRKEENGATKYELSLIGVLVVLAIITFLGWLPKQDRYDPKLPNPLYRSPGYYNIIASNYKEKLPLVFEHWDLLGHWSQLDNVSETLSQIFHKKDEIFSLSVLLGGNKEIYDNIHSTTLNVFNRLQEIYIEFTHVTDELKSEQHIFNANLKPVEEKLSEITTLLRYASIENFAKHFIDEQDKSFPYEHKIIYQKELSAIENNFAEEFTILFYLGLLRYNKHFASLYPFTTGFIPFNPNLASIPKDLLMKIIRKDVRIKNKVQILLNGAVNYQTKTLDKMNEINKEIDLC